MVSFTSSALLVAAAGFAAAQYGEPAPAPSSTSSATSSSSSSSPTSAAANSGAQVQVITVAPMNSLSFSPNSMTAPVGSQVEFDFSHITLQHSVTQGTFDDACVANSSGFFAGFNANPPSNAATFTITINDTNPIWYFCSFPGHCGAGMVGVINPDPNNSSQTIAAFTANAMGKTTTPGSTMQGGTVGPFVAASSGSSGSSSSGSSSSSSSAPATSSSSSSTSGAADSNNSKFAIVAMVGALAAGWAVSSLMM